MGKHEVGTPKYIANKIKAKGLQKLRWYCQMCQKQCRDENGFKCHTMSEAHQRQLLLFADNQGRFLDEFSREFEKGYLELLRRQFGTKRVPANKVYQDYIHDRNHLHMNATRWTSLTGFVKYLGREGKCVVDETEKGWFVTYIDRDPETIRYQEQFAKKEKLEKGDNEKMAEFLEKQIAEGMKQMKESENGSCSPTELKREEESTQKVELKLNTVKMEKKILLPTTSVFAKPAALGKTKSTASLKSFSSVKSEKRKLSALEAIIAEEKSRKRKIAEESRRDYWLSEGIVVKVNMESLGENFHNKKGVVMKVEDRYTAIVKMTDSGKRVKLDQTHVETVIPNIGKEVKIVNGPHRGTIGKLSSVNVASSSVNVLISSENSKTRIVSDISFEDVCKYVE